MGRVLSLVFLVWTIRRHLFQFWTIGRQNCWPIVQLVLSTTCLSTSRPESIISYYFEGKVISKTDCQKDIDAFIPDELKSCSFKKPARLAFNVFSMISRKSPSQTFATEIKLYMSMMLPTLMYCSVCWGATIESVGKRPETGLVWVTNSSYYDWNCVLVFTSSRLTFHGKNNITFDYEWNSECTKCHIPLPDWLVDGDEYASGEDMAVSQGSQDGTSTVRLEL